MERTLCFGSLPGRLARSGFSALVLQEEVIRVVGHIINPLLTELVRSRLVDTGLFSFAFLSATSYRSVTKKKTHAEAKKRAWSISRHLDLTLGQKRISVERVSLFHHVARSLSSALISQGSAFLLLSFLSFGPFSNA